MGEWPHSGRSGARCFSFARRHRPASFGFADRPWPTSGKCLPDGGGGRGRRRVSLITGGRSAGAGRGKARAGKNSPVPPCRRVGAMGLRRGSGLGRLGDAGRRVRRHDDVALPDGRVHAVPAGVRDVLGSRRPGRRPDPARPPHGRGAAHRGPGHQRRQHRQWAGRAAAPASARACRGRAADPATARPGCRQARAGRSAGKGRLDSPSTGGRPRQRSACSRRARYAAASPARRRSPAGPAAGRGMARTPGDTATDRTAAPPRPPGARPPRPSGRHRWGRDRSGPAADQGHGARPGLVSEGVRSAPGNRWDRRHRWPGTRPAAYAKRVGGRAGLGAARARRRGDGGHQAVGGARPARFGRRVRCGGTVGPAGPGQGPAARPGERPATARATAQARPRAPASRAAPAARRPGRLGRVPDEIGLGHRGRRPGHVGLGGRRVRRRDTARPGARLAAPSIRPPKRPADPAETRHGRTQS